MKEKIFSPRRLVSLLISAFIILCIRYWLNANGYVTYYSFIFILLCGFLRAIIQVIVDQVANNLNIKKKKKKLKEFFTPNNPNLYLNIKSYKYELEVIKEEHSTGSDK